MIYEDDEGGAVWRKQPRHGRAAWIPGAEEACDLLTSLPATISSAAAAVATGQVGAGLVPRITLSLTPADGALLHQAHRSSDWVITIDRTLGMEYFDTPAVAGGLTTLSTSRAQATAAWTTTWWSARGRSMNCAPCWPRPSASMASLWTPARWHLLRAVAPAVRKAGVQDRLHGADPADRGAGPGACPALPGLPGSSREPGSAPAR